MLSDLKNKSILLILPKYFGYERTIVSHLEHAGAIVYMVYEDMDEISYFYRFVNVYTPQYMHNIMNKYFLKKTLPVSNKLDFVLLIRGKFMNSDVLKVLKERTPDSCKFCMYQWDSIKNNSNALQIMDFFDYVSTFDPIDANNHGWTYRPLFYIPELINKKNEDIDVLYICSIHSNRIDVLNRLKRICCEKSLKLYKHVYSRKVIYYKRKYLNRIESYSLADNKDVSFRTLDVKDTYNLYNRSKIVVDYTHPDQNGFTMRTMETLGCGKKLITNNKNIIKADFYDPNNIIVYDGENVEIPDEFIEKKYAVLEKEIYEKYSIDFWILSIMGLTE